MEPYCVHYWLKASSPSTADLVKVIQAAALLSSGECRVTDVGSRISVYIVTDADTAKDLSRLFGVPAYAGPI